MSIHRSMGLIGGITALAVFCAVGGVGKADAAVIDFSGVGPGTVVPTYSEEGFTITAIPGAVQINDIFSIPRGFVAEIVTETKGR